MIELRFFCILMYAGILEWEMEMNMDSISNDLHQEMNYIWNTYACEHDLMLCKKNEKYMKPVPIAVH